LIVVSEEKDLLLHSVLANLAIRGFTLRDQVISYFSETNDCFIAAGKRPIPAEAIIPASELSSRKRLQLKVWPATSLPETLLLELDSRVQVPINA